MDTSTSLLLFSLLLLGCMWKTPVFVTVDVVYGYKRQKIPLIICAHKRTQRLFSEQKDDVNRETPQTDKEIAEALQKESEQKMAAYMSPMESGNIKGLDQRELIETFGEAFTTENIRKRQERSQQMAGGLAEEAPPTKLLPYFVNLQNPKNPLGDLPLEERELNGATITPQNHDQVASLDDSKHESKDDDSNTEDVQQTKLALFDNHADQIFQNDPDEKVSGDPLDPLFASENNAVSDDEDDDETEEQKQQKKDAWYRDLPASQLYPADMADGWSILPCGRIYKHLLKPSNLPKKMQRKPLPDSYVSFGFKFIDAFTGNILLEAADMKSDGVISQLDEFGEGLQKMLASMVTGEQAEFICHAVELDLADIKEEELKNLQWIRVWIYLVTLHQPGEKWWHMSPLEASKIPPIKEDPGDSKLTKMEKLNLQTEELTKQIETELENNPCSPLWDDILHKLSAQQKASFVEHFDRKLEMQERQKCAEYSGSRGFGEAIKATGQLGGYDVGRSSGGCGAFYSWHETPFIFYIAIPVVPGIRAEHVNLKLEPRHLTLVVGNKTIIDDDFFGQVETDSGSTWVMSEKAMEYTPLPPGHADLEDPVLKVSREDEYHKLIKDPCIIIALRKQDKAMGDWGTPFVNI
ncbi:hypothetical protein BgAZ_208610 [Babesia gibsoni]|uniref:CS domain-containing protein n=1 Tax=Babesia gibsoni TaxID=33632 RepID=A0AAD8PEQ8_BABGI|nr:hypothetical protein BgAZ_208610 [Babesia gibsoni]